MTTATIAEPSRFAAAPSQVFLGLNCGSHGHAPKRAAHKIGQRVARPNQHQRKQQKLRAEYADAVNPHHCAQRQSDEQKAGRADPDVSEGVS